jgi:hypothetical protein
LAGQYAFSMTGTELCSGQGSFFGRAGTFTADGNGNITAGLEDVNVCTGVETLPFTGGTYFPPDDRYGRPGFRRVLLTLADYWKSRRSDINAAAAEAPPRPARPPRAAEDWSIPSLWWLRLCRGGGGGRRMGG